MEVQTCSYEDIQTPIEVWKEILTKFPINENDIFFEPFKGEGNLYNQLTSNKKEYCEIKEDKNIFDYNFVDSKVTTIYTNPPFKCLVPITNKKKGIVQWKYKNCVYYFLHLFMTKCTHLHTVGFLINEKSFVSLTPKRLHELTKLGFYIHQIGVLNIQKWFGRYFFVLFKKSPSQFVIPFPQYF